MQMVVHSAVAGDVFNGVLFCAVVLCWEITVHLAVACDVYDGVFFMLSFFPRGVLDEILNLIESVSEVFSSYSFPLDVLDDIWA